MYQAYTKAPTVHRWNVLLAQLGPRFSLEGQGRALCVSLSACGSQSRGTVVTAVWLPVKKASPGNHSWWFWLWTNQWASGYVFQGLQTRNKSVSDYKVYVVSNFSLQNTRPRDDAVPDSFFEGVRFDLSLPGHAVHTQGVSLSLQRWSKNRSANLGCKVEMSLPQVELKCTVLRFCMISYLS